MLHNVQDWMCHSTIYVPIYFPIPVTVDCEYEDVTTQFVGSVDDPCADVSSCSVDASELCSLAPETMHQSYHDEATSRDPVAVSADVVAKFSSTVDNAVAEGEPPSEEVVPVDVGVVPGVSSSSPLPPEAVAQLQRALCSLSGIRLSIAISRLKQISTSTSTEMTELLGGASQAELLEYIGLVSQLIDKEAAANPAT